MKKFTACLLIAGISSTAFAQTKDQDFHLDKEYKVQPNGIIYLNASDAKVSITGSSRKTAHVKIDREVSTKGLVFGSEEFRVDVDEDNGGLRIKEHSRSTNVGIIGYHYEKYTIALDVPDGVSLQVRGDDGDYLIKSVNGVIDVTLDDGDLELVGCKGNDFKFQLDDGDIKMDEGRGSLDVDADDADIRIEKGNFSKIHANMDDGDFIIETSLSNSGEYYINAQDGLVSLTILTGGGKFDIRHDDGHVLADGGFSMVEESEDHTRLTLANGSAKVDIRADDARVRLTSR